MQTEPNAKQQIVERIKNSTNILVTVGKNPSVDALSAALSLTLMLNRLEKHATAVFSGEIPPAINFLDPKKTFENTVDSLRDFIIALDKEKADRLRYKVEDDVVRIFITPYRTVITDKDLKFSQGDFNVELIIALGVEKREDLDTAITAHGRILHDATVMTINSDGAQSTLGALDWTDTSASSLCEMLMSLSEALQSGLLDQQIATAVLTGIVSATDRFRNERTSPRVMTMAAQLMAAGANQQLIAAKLEEGHELPEVATPIDKSRSKRDETQPANVDKQPKKKKNDGSLEIKHEPVADTKPANDPSADALKEAEAELAKSLEQTAPAVPAVSQANLEADLETESAKQGNEKADTVEQGAAPEASPPPVESTEPSQHKETEQKDLEQVKPKKSEQKTSPKIIKQPKRSWRADAGSKPTFGGTLNATTDEEEKTKREEVIAQTGNPTLTHDQPFEPPQKISLPPLPLEDTETPEAKAPTEDPQTNVDQPLPTPEPLATEPHVSDQALEPTPAIPAYDAPVPVETPAPLVNEPDSKPLESTSDDALSFEPAPIAQNPEPTTDTNAADEASRDQAAEDARAAVDAALGAMPFNPAGQPLESAGAAPVFEVAHNETVTPPAPTAYPENQPSVVPAPPPLPPLPDFTTLPPLPGEQPVESEAPQVPQTVPLETTQIPNTPLVDIDPPATQQPPSDPGQFKIPGQP